MLRGVPAETETVIDNVPVGSSNLSVVSGRYVFGDNIVLHIDVDGAYPLLVVSGTIKTSGRFQDHFIGRVTNYDPTESLRQIEVSDFNARLPGASAVADQLTIEIAKTGSGLDAQAIFSSSRTGPVLDPIRGSRASPFFRRVEIEVDREEGARAMEPYDTHSHTDRPDDLPRETLTLESAYAKSGIEIVRSGQENVIKSSWAGPDARWSDIELHDAMEAHWSAFANVPQWKMWVFAARLSESYGGITPAGIMFDGDIDEPGGVDRQGTAIFTEDPLHAVDGFFARSNPPAAAAAQRELFFDMMHESGHAFNLFHSFVKGARDFSTYPWTPPSWAGPVRRDDDALSWMNYPIEATTAVWGQGRTPDARWFYRNFRFRFDNRENLFLRHAPEEFVRMGDESWASNYARIADVTPDGRLELSIRGNKAVWEYGEPVVLEFRLRNKSHETTSVHHHHHVHPSGGSVRVAITEPDGTRRPWIPVRRIRWGESQQELEADGRLYASVDLTMGKLGFPFKTPGKYKIEAVYQNCDGGMATAEMALEVRPAPDEDTKAAVQELFDARVGRVLQAGGTRVMEDVTERLDRVSARLGERHPTRLAISALKARPFARAFKQFTSTSDVKLLDPDPELVVRQLEPVIQGTDQSADTLGNIEFASAVDMYTDCCASVKKQSLGLKAQETMLAMFEKRKVIAPVLDRITNRIKTLK